MESPVESQYFNIGQGPVLAIVPAHNEAGRIGAVVTAVAAQGLPVLVVDDGSVDDTGAEAAAAGAQVLRLEPNRGKGGALKAGFREALAMRALPRGSALARRPPRPAPAKPRPAPTTRGPAGRRF